MNERLLWIGGLAAGGVALAAGLVFAASKQAVAAPVQSVPPAGSSSGGQTTTPTPVTSTPTPVQTPIQTPIQTPVSTPINPIVATNPVQQPIPSGSQTGPIQRPSPVTVTSPTGNPVFAPPPAASTTSPATPSSGPSNTQTIVVGSNPNGQPVTIAPNTDVFLTLPSGAWWISVADYQTSSSFDYTSNPGTWAQNVAMAPPAIVTDVVRRSSGSTPIEFTYLGTPLVSNPNSGAMVAPPMSMTVFWMDATGNKQATTLQINSF